MRSRQDKEAAILWCLAKEPGGMYATDLCRITGMWRGTIYARLGLMDEAGLVHMVRDDGPYPQRYRYFLGAGVVGKNER